MITPQARRQLDQLRRLDRGLFASAIAAIQAAPDLATPIAALGLKAVIAKRRAAGQGTQPPAPERTFVFAPGDGGLSDQDLAAGPTAEYRRMLAQSQASAPPAGLAESPVATAAAAPADLWDQVTARIAAPNLGLTLDGEVVIWQSGRRAVSIWRRKLDGLIVLVARDGSPGMVTSRPIAMQDRDQGGFKLMSAARANYLAWEKTLSTLRAAGEGDR